MLPQEKRNSHKPEKCYLSTDDGELIETSGLIDFKKTLLFEGISENTFHIITNPDEKAHSLIMNQPGENGLAGVLNKKLIIFRHQ